MDLGIADKRAFVSGSTAGIGFAIAASLAAEGASVTINGRTQGRVDEALAALRARNLAGKVDGVAADLTTAEGLDAVLRVLPEADIVINNLGIFEPKPFLEIPDEDWRRFFDVNVLSGVRCSRAYLPGMVARGWGRLVFISSESGLQIPSEMVHYGMTKTAQLAVARGIAESVAASEGVSGFVDDLARTQGKDRQAVEADFFREMRPSSLIKRFATTEEVAALVTYVCSVQASATTGASLRVDGGVLRSIA
jgi:NAD(P)-dependent dehydrogenase (short-subunit alcohol dehydrogenase family)